MSTSRHPFDKELQVIRAKEYRPKDGSEPGERVRVIYAEMPELHRMLGGGWARHLPVEVAAMFIVVATQSHSNITGDLMWFNIRDLYPKTLRELFVDFPQVKKIEVAERFAKEYGKPYKTTVKGLIGVLLDLGLIEQYWDDQGEGLRVPDTLPSPADVLDLSEEELSILAWRKQLTHTSLIWVDPEVQERGHL